MERKKIKFWPHLVPLIESGEKTATWRLFDDKDLQVGDELDFVNTESGHVFTSAVITSVEEKKFKDIKYTDFDGHEHFENMEEMIANYQGYYPDHKVDENSKVKIVRYSLILED